MPHLHFLTYSYLLDCQIHDTPKLIEYPIALIPTPEGSDFDNLTVVWTSYGVLDVQR